MLSAVIFDLGNTLVRLPWDYARSVEKGLGEEKSLFDSLIKIIYDSLVKSGIDLDWSSFYDKYMAVRSEQWRRRKETLREFDMYERVSGALGALGLKVSPASGAVRKAVDDHYASCLSYAEMEEEVPQILQDLHSKRKLGLITNFAHSPTVYIMLEKFGLRKFFDVVLVSREVGWVKPSPKIFQAALSSLNLRSSQCVFVGDDAETDIKGARGVGMKTIFISMKGSTCQEADATIHRLTELGAAIEKLEK